MNANNDLEQELVPRVNGQFQSQQQAAAVQKPLRIFFEDELPYEYSGRNLPTELAQRRNLTIQALLAQTIASVTGYGFFFFRRIPIYFFVNTISLIFVYIGFQGATTLQKWKIAAHSVATMGILGSCFAYFLLEAMFAQKTKTTTGDIHHSERTTLFLLSLPYLIDLIVGVISFKLTYYMFKLEETRESLRNQNAQNQEFIGAHERHSSVSTNCVVCANFRKNCVIIPCGHLALCNYCANEFKQRRVTMCPICRSRIQDIVRTYN